VWCCFSKLLLEGMIITLTNSKGGVGKTFVAVHLACWLIQHGYSVVLVDSDPQQQANGYRDLANLELEVVILQSEEEIESALPELAEEYDVVIVDAPGEMSQRVITILSLADFALLPSGGSQNDVRGLAWSIEVIKEIQHQRNEITEVTSQRDLLPKTIVLPIKASNKHKTTRNLKNKAKRLGFGVTKNTLPIRQIFAQAGGVENEAGDGGWDIEPNLIWNLGKSKKVRDAALEMDALFNEMFPDCSEENPNLIRNLVTPKKRINQ